jgi:hypothetical protein
MAGLALLDGSTAAFDFTTVTYPAGTAETPAKSWKCVASYFSIDFGRRMEDRTTFCTTGGWASGVPTLMQGAIRIDGFASKGIKPSDPLYLFVNTHSVDFVATVDSSCTLTGSMHAVGHHTGLRAQGASEMGVSAVTDGPVTSAWVTT